jgi:hypothetical protein
MFESLWIDQTAAEEVLTSLETNPATSEVARQLRHFHQFGYCIVPNAVPAEVIDQYMVEYKSLIADENQKFPSASRPFPPKVPTFWYP